MRTVSHSAVDTFRVPLNCLSLRSAHFSSGGATLDSFECLTRKETSKSTIWHNLDELWLIRCYSEVIKFVKEHSDVDSIECFLGPGSKTLLIHWNPNVPKQ